jgi:hypothetical protein
MTMKILHCKIRFLWSYTNKTNNKMTKFYHSIFKWILIIAKLPPWTKTSRIAKTTRKDFCIFNSITRGYSNQTKAFEVWIETEHFSFDLEAYHITYTFKRCHNINSHHHMMRLNSVRFSS